MQNTTADGLTGTLVYRRFGVGGLRWFGRFYFPLLLLCMLALETVIFWATQYVSGQQRTLTRALSLVLLVLALLLVVRMWRGFRRDVSDLEV
ncbi:hypothetical protein Pla52o_42690 [Novipirellula galeiformis]|uniref:Uncharacterized protein n=1 Tax=Novipirellula galeiformis TaxID=2528004 RepID=A0A5C6CAH3_9BACT|nr:hypothetical protein [Novipirellula galeiformis]TWU20394.1 hypothetical protein Pla52o_42690 [Novipirellula galeiformis]